MNDYKNLKSYNNKIWTAIQLIGILAILIIGGAFDWMNFRFDFSKLSESSYWNGVIVQVLMYSIALIIGYLGRIQKEQNTNKEYERLMNLYHTYLIQKSESFVSFIDSVINPRVQRHYYKEHIKRKLYRQEVFTSFHDKWKVEYDKALDFVLTEKKEIYDYKVSKHIYFKHSCKHYIVRRYLLESFITDDVIVKRARNWKWYPRVNSHAFTWGIHKRDQSRNNYQVSNRTGLALSKGFIQKSLSVVLISMMIASIFVDPNKNQLLEQANGLLKLMMLYMIRVFSTIWSYVSGVYMGKGIFEDNFINVVSNRNSLLEEYINWKATNQEKESTAYKIKQAVLIEKETPKVEEKKPEVQLTEEEKQNIINKELANREAQNLVNQALSN